MFLPIRRPIRFYRSPTITTRTTVSAEIMGPIVRGPGGTKPYDLTINFNQYVARPVPRLF